MFFYKKMSGEIKQILGIISDSKLTKIVSSCFLTSPYKI